MSEISMMDLIAPTTPAKTTSVEGVRTIHDLAGMEFSELMELRNEIDRHLPAIKLSDVNLAEELVLQFQTVKHLQTDVLAIGSKTSAQQQAAVTNSCTSSLAHLVKMQTELHNAERFKVIEGLMVKHMKTLPLEVATKFIDDYEKLISE